MGVSSGFDSTIIWADTADWPLLAVWGESGVSGSGVAQPVSARLPTATSFKS